VRPHILTVSVEEFFHAGAFRGAVHRKHWDRFESRLGDSLDQVLNQLRRFNQTATFFVLGCVAHSYPDLVGRILEDGHEVASSSYWPRTLEGMLPAEFREDLARTRDALRAAGAADVRGFRASRGWMRRDDLWALDILAEEGYAYDSSLSPILRRFPGEPERYRIHTHRTASGLTIDEFPISTIGILGVRLAFTGGNWVRQFPHTLLRRVVSSRDRRARQPMVFYFMPWELDRDQPHLAGLSWLTRVRHYRNLAKTRWVFEDHFRTYRFQSIGEYLGLVRAVPAVPAEAPAWRPAGGVRTDAPSTPQEAGEPVTLVVPLFNEDQNVGYLLRTLCDFRQRLAGRYRVHLVLVDDGSSDGTWAALTSKFGGVPDCRLIRHPSNRGVAAAILTGIEGAPTEVVCSIDCDCSYDPSCLAEMIPLIDGADLVTASPYHPEGRVLNVPSWRLFLSKTLSRLYSAVLRDRLHTFTSCCRVYRKPAVAGLSVSAGGFLGVAETLIRLKLNGARVVEHPATLESRLLGESKMKILRTMWGHLGLLGELAFRETRVKGRAALARSRRRARRVVS
jgi:polysaccharide deacetylase family protein (PEP-CTERM system associated)